MRLTSRRLVVCLLWVPLTLSSPRAAQPPAQAARVDQLFARWDRPDSPGCAVAVIHDGKVIHRRGYGMANLEHGVPISPSTVFNIASVSKQFTAFLILLLAGAGQLSLDDDVRTHVPELPDFGKKITVRHLIHHTSGLREDWSMLTLAGWRMEDVVTERDVLTLVGRQRELNFEPGEQYLYCNTGYNLMGVIVRRVSGRPLREFAREKIFAPLGMKGSQFQDDHRLLIPNRASSYGPKGDGFENVCYASGRAGPGNLYTTVDDLALWDRNFYDHRVGGKEVAARVLEKFRLNDGKEIDYAAGLRHGQYRGLKTVEHLGAIAGYRAALLRFPEQRFTVILLANVSTFPAGATARRVADVYLDDKMTPAPKAPELKEAKIDPKKLADYLGEYRFASGLVVTVRGEKDGLAAVTASGAVTLRAASPTEFFTADGVRYTFVPKGKGEMRLVVRQDTQAQEGRRFAPPALAARLAEYAGDFHSAELQAVYGVAVVDGKLLLRHRKGETTLRPLAEDEFAGEIGGPLLFRFTRDGKGRVRELLIDGSRVRNVRFARAEIKG